MCADRQQETPTRLSVSEAAKVARIGRSTINKHIAEGKLSKSRDESGRVYIDVSELARVYPSVDIRTVSEMRPDGQQETPKKAAVDSALQIEVATLRERLEAANVRLERETRLLSDTVDDLRRRLDAEAEERRKLTMLLTDQRKAEPEPVPVAPEKPTGGRLARAWAVLTGKI